MVSFFSFYLSIAALLLHHGRLQVEQHEELGEGEADGQQADADHQDDYAWHLAAEECDRQPDDGKGDAGPEEPFG